MPRQDDVDDFMASILGGSPAPAPKPKASVFSRKHEEHKQQHTQAPHHAHAKRAYQTTEPKRTRSSKKVLRFFLMLLVVTAVTGGGYLLWRGPISGLLEPKSPFSTKIQENMGVPLYFPTKLPGSFKIETDSITQPEGGVVLYAITDDDGKRINITLQKQPGGISLDPLYAALQNARDIQTKFGSIKTGTTSENVDVTNILTGKTWVLINTPKDTLKDEQLISLIDSLKEVSKD